MSPRRPRLPASIAVLLTLMTLVTLAVEARPEDPLPEAVVAPAASSAAASSPAMRVDSFMVRYRHASRQQTIRGIQVRRAVPVPAQLMESRRQRLAALLGLPVDGVTLVRQVANGAHLFRMSRSMEIEALTSGLKAGDADIETMTPNRQVRARIATRAQIRGEPYFRRQWSLRAIGLPAALTQSDGTGVVVAVLDSGRVDHADLAGKWLPGRDFVSARDALDGDGWDHDAADVRARSDGVVNPTYAHGLNVAGILAARLDGAGMVGVAPGAQLLPVRVLEGEVSEDSDIIDGIYWAVGDVDMGDEIPVNPTPARILNLSVGSYVDCSSGYQDAVDFARAKGAVVVAAAGNEGMDVATHTPSNCSGVISVGAANRNGRLSKYSNFNVDLLAPGGATVRTGHSDLLTTSSEGTDSAGEPDYVYAIGTSLSAPHVAGVVALMLEVAPAATPEQVKQALLAGATPMPDCEARKCGAGLLNAPGALNKIRELMSQGVIASP